jgi:hypothetical protein
MRAGQALKSQQADQSFPLDRHFHALLPTARADSGQGRIIQASPLLKRSAKFTANRIEFTSTGATISISGKLPGNS